MFCATVYIRKAPALTGLVGKRRAKTLFGACVHDSHSYDATSGGEKEIQRTMLELLNQLDGFEARGDVKVILATNRIESLDPALIRPGRIDRKIQLPSPDTKTKRKIFQVRFFWYSLSLRLALGRIRLD